MHCSQPGPITTVLEATPRLNHGRPYRRRSNGRGIGGPNPNPHSNPSPLPSSPPFAAFATPSPLCASPSPLCSSPAALKPPVLLLLLRSRSRHLLLLRSVPCTCSAPESL